MVDTGFISRTLDISQAEVYNEINNHYLELTAFGTGDWSRSKTKKSFVNLSCSSEVNRTEMTSLSLAYEAYQGEIQR